MARHGAVMLGMLAALLLISAGPAAAGPVTIKDDSHVLDAGRVKDAADAVPDPVQIFTTERLADNSAAFDQEAQSHVTAPNDVVVAINTKSKHLAIRTGANSHIKDASPAVAAFKNGFGSGDYTAATIGALNSLAQAANQAAPAPSRANHPAPQAKPSHHNNGFSLWSVLCPLVVIAGVVLAVVAFLRRRRGGGGGGGFPGGGNQPGGYGPGGYGPGGDPGYDPNYGGRRGMSPGMAGGLGAAAGAVGGGLLGYELGRMGHEEEHAQGFDQPAPEADPGQAPEEWGGGGGDADFGGGDTGSDSGGGGFDGGGGTGDF
ncbi:hypothetical protein [Nocardia pseudobrasiliensis]|uniref:Membrane protein YgcG n=1 Tax=Nocardia pseudobrasiliensis TaxID=45979 RepID=A0A370I2J7_9NOCA|nr:hypothetical protein [Nocardia pseudobrasiliensis]RDI64391.1 hypothetical protein DFR76_108224 [Nocardia pseudobrasiliensis]